MTEEKLQKELLTLERQYWQGVKDKNIEACMRLTDDPCIVAGASGVARIDRKTFTKMMQNAKYTLEEFELSDDAQVRAIGNDVAILAYKVREKLTVDGKHVTMEASDASTWVRKNGRWVCALHTESLIGDPFGRDRRPS
jgi:hypothetical protein